MSKMSELALEFQNEHHELIETGDLEELEKARDEFLEQKVKETMKKGDEENKTIKSCGLFRKLDKEEEKEFRQWARDNYKPYTEISSIWHPMVRNECEKINIELKSKK